MFFHAFADKLSPSGQDEIAPDALPHEMKFVVVKPHISPETLDGVFLIPSIIGLGAGLIDLADVILPVKDSEVFGLGKR
jgi:hypothetical protein